MAAPRPGGARHHLPSALEQLLQCLLVGAQAPKPVPPVKTVITNIKTLLQGLLPEIPASAARMQPGHMRWDWVCFSCGKAGHGATRCPELNEAFPFMLPGWKAEKVGSGYAMISRPSGSGTSRLIWGGGGGGQPPGSVMELNTRTMVVVRRSSLPPEIWP